MLKVEFSIADGVEVGRWSNDTNGITGTGPVARLKRDAQLWPQIAARYEAWKDASAPKTAEERLEDGTATEPFRRYMEGKPSADAAPAPAPKKRGRKKAAAE